MPIRRAARRPGFRSVTSITALAAALLLRGVAPAFADEKPKEPDFSKGALHGKVTDLATGKPVAGATVALKDKDGKVLAWTKTDDKGEYAIAADTLTVLSLRPSRRKGLLEEIARTVGDVVTAPVKVVGEVVKDPVGTAKTVAVTAATGNPIPATVGAVKAVAEDPAKPAKEKAAQAKENAVKTVLGERQAAAKEKKAVAAPGETVLVVTAPSYKDLNGKAGAYWLEPREEKSDKTPKPCGPKAWLETVQLAPMASDKPSAVAQAAFLVADCKAEPSLVTPGGTLKIVAKLQSPPGEKRPVRLFARESKKKTVVELRPGENGLYAGELKLDEKCDIGDTVVSVVALREEPIDVKLDRKKADPLLEFVRRLDDLDSDKPYEYDPRIMASENRVDLAVTVLDPKKATPSGK
jgi:hypothetical protein